MKSSRLRGVTLLELIVVVLIISILSSIAVSVYTGYVRRAQIATARATIHELELAAARYQIDTGEFPLSSSGTLLAPNAPNGSTSAFGGTNGCGYLMVCLLHSDSGDAFNPLSLRWQGPYLEVDEKNLGAIDVRDADGDGNNSEIIPITAATPLAQICLLDPWGSPYYYVRSDDYAAFNATEPVGVPITETYYNPSTVQIFSLGFDGTTPAQPLNGTGLDDIRNF
ncbi:prepilin-type N-terminal cleavage/methylation domain-containing protein [Candidatus Sumerlaeota bacterium]|nr:prepilin-type N-terminal cleavage/methylation domain-containing protein [Candidatus Sumerlaeota bacterium]